MKILFAQENDHQRWDAFVRTNHGAFTQSWNWGTFLSNTKIKAWRLLIEKDNQILAVMNICLAGKKIARNLNAPKGPILLKSLPIEEIKSIMKLFLTEIEKIAKITDAIIFWMDPETNDPKWEDLYDELNFDKSEGDNQPRHTIMLNLNLSEEELLKQMHPKTRYNINLAHKKGVIVTVDNSRLKEFWELLKKTEERQAIKLYSWEYFENLLKIPFTKLYCAHFEGKVIAVGIMVFWNNQATYLFGASDYNYRNLMAPHLVQWTAIKDAKREGLAFYDFWGAAPKNASGREENWSGFTKFKMGFSPNAEITEYLGTYEKVFNPMRLGIYNFIRKIF